MGRDPKIRNRWRPVTHTHTHVHHFSTKYSLEIISKYLRKNEENFDYRAEFLISTALEIVAKIILLNLAM